jgi:hypothetical protein
MLRHQKGITFVGFVMLLCVVGFFVYAAMKLVPVYTMHMGVVKSMKQLQLEPGINEKSIDEIRRDLNVKFDLQYVDESIIPPANMQLKKQGGASSLRIFYDRRVPFLYNVDLLVSFDNTVDLSKGGTY